MRGAYQFEPVNRFIGLFDDDPELVDEVRVRPGAAGGVIVGGNARSRSKQLV